LTTAVPADLIREAFEGKTGIVEKLVDYKGVPALTICEPAGIEGLDWFVVAEKGYHETILPALALRTHSILIGVIAMFAVVLAALLFTRGIITPIKRMREAANRIASGDLSARIKVEAYGHVGRFAEAFNIMADRLMQSRGEIEAQNLTLEESVEARTAELRKTTEDLEKKNHLLATYNDILSVLNADLEIGPLLNNVLDTIVRRADAQLGVIYLCEEEKKGIFPLATYGLDMGLIEKGFEIGKGVPGQAAASKRTILVKDVPEDYLRVSSGSFEGIPRNVLCIPITFKDRVEGVLELGIFHDFTVDILDFFELAVSQLGIGIHNARSFLQLQELSADLQGKNEELQSQNEEIQAQSEEMQSQNEEIQAQSEELQSQKKILEEKSRMATEADRLKSEFLSNMSHELRTPLNSILGLTSLLTTGAAGEVKKKQAEYLAVIERNGKNLLVLMNDILDLARIESGMVDIDITEIPLKGFLTDIAGTTGSLIREKNLILDLDVEEDISIYGDANKLRQIVTNLLGNAIKFTEQGEIRISAEVKQGKEQDMVAISVRDRGIGIPKEALPYIFDPFRQVDGSITRRYGGTGLGLSICRRLAELLNGKIEVATEPGKGSTFTITIPKDRRNKFRPEEDQWQEKVKRTLLSEIEAHSREEAPANEAIDILIIDDDPIVIRELQIILKQTNYRLRLAYNGREGLQKIKNQAPDLILLDLRMPGMDGFDVLQELRREGGLKEIPVMIITAAELTESEKRDLTKNVKGVITKGQINRQPLLNTIEEILSESANARPVERSDGPYKILIVEDAPDNMFFITETLRPSGHTLYHASDGQEGVELAKEKRPDLILMDIQLPVLSGYEATKQIKETRGLKGIPIIALTARAMKGDREKMRAAGFDDYLSKPVHPDGLIGRVEEWLGRPIKE